MIESYPFLSGSFEKDVPKELSILSIISQSFFQPFSLEDNLLVILTALTSGTGVGFNRAMLFLTEGERLRGEIWLGPRSTEEATAIWEVLSTPGIGYQEIIEYNRWLISSKENNLSRHIKNLSFSLNDNINLIPAAALKKKEILLVKNAHSEPGVDRRFLEIIRADEFLCIPLLSQDEMLGMIITDNNINRLPITLADIRLAGVCGLLAGNYISNSRLHQKLVESEKMAAMGEIAMFLSHQLRNPLVAIGGFVEQLVRPDLPEEKKQRNLAIILSEIKRLEKIVFEMSHFLKITLRDSIWFDPWPEIKAVLQSPELSNKIPLYRWDIRIEEEPVELFCDPTSFGEALRNIIDNAFDSTPEGGIISVRAYLKSSSWLAISVRDSGSGISNPDKAKIFRPFFTTKENGLGLGLVFVKRVMDSCGGRIEFRTRPGKGTIFHLLFPCRPKNQTEKIS